MAINIDITKGGAGYHLMTIFDDAARVHGQAGRYEEKLSLETAVNLVNNIHHGKPLSEWYPFLRDTLKENSESSWASEADTAAYQEASALLEEYVDLVEAKFSVTIR